jgi:hypothetical protein
MSKHNLFTHPQGDTGCQIFNPDLAIDRRPHSLQSSHPIQEHDHLCIKSLQLLASARDLQACANLWRGKESGCSQKVNRMSRWLAQEGWRWAHSPKGNHNIQEWLQQSHHGRDNIWLRFGISRDGEIARPARLERVHGRHAYQGDASNSTWLCWTWGMHFDAR